MAKIMLVACVSKKLDRPAPAAELYQSVWFLKARQYAELIADRWYILSAHYGLVIPTEVIAPYDLTMKQLLGQERRLWSQRVLAALRQDTHPERDEIIFLAGRAYRAYLARWLSRLGYTVSVPLEGLRMGQQLRWLTQQIVVERGDE